MDNTRQQELENHALAQGRIRFLKRLESAQQRGQVSTVGAGKHLLQSAIHPLEEAMSKALAEKAHKRGVRHIAETFVPAVGVDVTAYIGVRVVLNEVLRKMPVALVAFEIADLMLDDLRFRRFHEEAPALWEHKLKKFATGSYVHKRRSLVTSMNRAEVLKEDGSLGHIEVQDLSLTDAQRLALGVWVLNQVISATGLVEIETVTQVRRGKRTTQKIVVATKDTLDWMNQRNSALELLWPVALPMVEPPLPWGPKERGGYRYGLRAKYAAIRGVSKEHQRTLQETAMPQVYAALNAIQSTAWKINTPVAEVVEEIIHRGGDRAGIPLLLQQDLPPKPVVNEELEIQRKLQKQELKKTGVMPNVSPEMREYLEVWRKWKKQAGIIRNENHERQYTRTAMLRLLSVVEEYKQEPRMYFVYNCDFRGRVYPVVSTMLSPQGDDVAKGLLTFAEGRPLGRDGRRYLAQHGAGCLDEWGGIKFTKVSIQERVQWIEDHSDWIVNMARDPMAYTDWMQADSPFCFLAFCFEWAKLMDFEGPSEDFVSSLPCAMDGSCNGIQHFSAMLRDPIGGEAVNLVPSPLPQDIYSRVQKRVLDLLERDAAQSPKERVTYQRQVRIKGKRKPVETTKAGRGTLALLWLTSGLITRKLVKRPVMTYPYGSRGFGFAQQTLEFLKHQGGNQWESLQLWRKAQEHFKDGEIEVVRDAAQYLAEVIMEALETTVVAAAHAMEWLQECARLVTQQGQCVQWTVPGTGFLVKQEYFETEEQRVDTMLLGSIYKPTIQRQTKKPHAVKQANGVSPNVVHSLDASALMLTVLDAQSHGVESFAMIHDSYGAPAGDCAVLSRSIRQCFVQLYNSADVVNSLAQQFKAQIPEKKHEKMPATPPMGTLDLSGIYASEFFFA